MSNEQTVKPESKKKTVMIAVFVPLGVVLVLAAALVLALMLLQSPDVKYDDAVKIVKKDFGCEEIVWCGDLYSDTQFIPEARVRSGSMCFVAMKNGKEVVVVVPDYNDRSMKPFVAEWPYVLSYSEIVRRFEARGFEYKYEDYYGNRYDCFKVCDRIDKVDDVAGYFHCDEGFYDRLDVKAVLVYGRQYTGTREYCMITQENNEVMLYIRDYKINEITVSKL